MTSPSSIIAVALDVDGVLTQGEIILLPNGDELKIFNAKDGHGIRMLLKAGIHVAWITGRSSQCNLQRAEDLGVTSVFQNTRNKLETLQGWLSSLGFDPEADLARVAYMGDDLPDLSVLERVGLATCPADAVEAVKSVCHWIAPSAGGKGSVRALAEKVLAIDGRETP
jgi:3-deoxy-D-manno-octulosonate 8-phosphate phosphatase (KDO 8-P phosphatase)